MDATDDLLLGEVSEGEEEGGVGGSRREPVLPQAGDADPLGARLRDDGVLVDVERQQEHAVAPRSEPSEAVGTEDGGDLRGQGVAAGAVEGADPSQMAVETPRLDEQGQRLLVEPGRTSAAQLLLLA